MTKSYELYAIGASSRSSGQSSDVPRGLRTGGLANCYESRAGERSQREPLLRGSSLANNPEMTLHGVIKSHRSTAIAVGICAAFFAGLAFTSASAAPPFAGLSEVQIPLLGTSYGFGEGFPSCASPTDWQTVGDVNLAAPCGQPTGSTATTIDASRYPAGATVQLEGWASVNNGRLCIRLYDVTGNAPVVGSNTCLASDSSSTHRAGRFFSAPFAFPAGIHDLVVQGQSTALDGSACLLQANCDPTFNRARLTVHW